MPQDEFELSQDEFPASILGTSAEASTTASDAGSTEGNLREMALHSESSSDMHADNQQDGHAMRQRSGELEVVDVNFSGRAQRRLARHARRARIPLVSRALVLEEDCVDVEQVASEVLPAEPEHVLSMDVSSDEGDALSVSQARVVPQATHRRPGRAAAPNMGRLARLPLRGRRRQDQDQAELSSPAAARVSDAFCHAGTATRAATATRADATWASPTLTSAGFEGQPTSSSSSSSSILPTRVLTGSASGSSEMPPILQVPLSPDLEEVNSQDVESSPLLSSRLQLEPTASAPSGTAPVTEAADSQSFSSLYVEHVRPGMEPRHCRECHEAFRMGQLRLGYNSGMAAGGRAVLPTWVHALDCSRRALFGLRLDGERVSFSPAVSMADRNRLIAELSQARPRPREQQLCIRPWRYLPSVLQHWPMVRLEAQRENQDAHRSTSSRPGWRLPSPARDSPERHVVAVPESGFSDDERSDAEGTGAGIESSVRRAQAVLEHLLSGRLPTPPLPPPHPPPFLQFHAGPFPPVPSFLPHQRDGDAEATTALAAASARAMLAEVPIFEATKKSDEPCVICRDDIKVGDVCRRLPCLHLFHRECIDHWIGVKANCPLCNLKLDEMLSKQRSLENIGNTSPPSPGGHSRRSSRSRSRSRMRGQDDAATGWLHSTSEQNGNHRIDLEWGSEESWTVRQRFLDAGSRANAERHQHYRTESRWNQGSNWSNSSRASHDSIPTARSRDRPVATRWGVRPNVPGDWAPSQNWPSSAASMSGPRHRLAGVAPHSSHALRGQSFGSHPPAPAQLPPWSAPIPVARALYPPLPPAVPAMPSHHSMPALPAMPHMPPMPARPLARPVFPAVRDRSRSPPPARTF